MGVGKKFLDAAVARFQILYNCIDLDAVAGRQEHPFFDSGIRAEPEERLPETAFRNRQLFPDFHRCSLVAEPDNNDMHETVRYLQKVRSLHRRRPTGCNEQWID